MAKQQKKEEKVEKNTVEGKSENLPHEEAFETAFKCCASQQQLDAVWFVVEVGVWDKSFCRCDLATASPLPAACLNKPTGLWPKLSQRGLFCCLLGPTLSFLFIVVVVVAWQAFLYRFAAAAAHLQLTFRFTVY